MEEELNHDNWAGKTYGTGWMHRWLIRSLRVIDVRLLYPVAYLFVVPPSMCINHKSTKAVYNMFRTKFKMGRLKAAWMTYRNHCAFSQVVIDKFAMYAGKKFKITIDGLDQFEDLAKSPESFVQLSSHIGNYEIAGYSLVVEDKRLNALVFGNEKDTVMAGRSKLFDGNNIRMIPMKPDMSHLFAMNAAVANGEIISISADRVHGSQKAFEIDFIGAPAKFPQGPFVLAASKNIPMLFVAVNKRGSKHYHITACKITVPAEGNIRTKAKLLATEYVKQLETIVREYPTHWHNYFDFWNEFE